MTVPNPTIPTPDPHAPRRLSPNVATLGYVSMLTAMSSAMIYGLLPVFLGISALMVVFFYLLSSSFDAPARDEQRRVRPGETITI